MNRSRLGRGVRIAVIGIAAITLFTFLVMNLWNWLVPPVIGWHTISFWQALGLLTLSRILFGGFRGPRRHWHWRHRLQQRWEQMTPEEREKFREGLRYRCSPSPLSDPHTSA